MTFEDYFSRTTAAGRVNANSREICQQAWNAALCAAAAACLDKGKIRDGHACLQAISDLHTWAATEISPS